MDPVSRAAPVDPEGREPVDPKGRDAEDGPPKANASEASPPASRAEVTGGSAALVITASVGIAAKGLGVLIAPGVRGVVSQNAVELVENLSATFAYTLAALLVALVCGASFELARSRQIRPAVRGSVVAVSGLVVALASPAVVQRLHTVAALALAVVTSLIVLVAGAFAARAARTRAVGAILALLAICALLRVVGWEMAASSESATSTLYDVGRGFATAAVILHALTTAVAAVWLGTRSKWRGRLLANAAVVLAFVATYVAARGSEVPGTIEAILRASLGEAAGGLVPAGVRSIAAFLVPVSVLLAIVALVQRVAHTPTAILAAVSLALLAHGAFDVPLHALLATAAAQWTLLAMNGQRSAAPSAAVQAGGAQRVAPREEPNHVAT